jgi:ribosome assembly protein YihI (activator of Der GTPase)
MQEELEELDKTDKVSAALQEYVSEKTQTIGLLLYGFSS